MVPFDEMGRASGEGWIGWGKQFCLVTLNFRCLLNIQMEKAVDSFISDFSVS